MLERNEQYSPLQAEQLPQISKRKDQIEKVVCCSASYLVRKKDSRFVFNFLRPSFADFILETTAICDLQTMLDAKERLIRENFKSELTSIKRIKTIYDKPTGFNYKFSPNNIISVVIEDKNSEKQKSEIPAGVINANRTFDKRLRLLEAKLDHLSRQIGRLSK